MMKLDAVVSLSSAIRVLMNPEVLVSCHYYSQILLFIVCSFNVFLVPKDCQSAMIVHHTKVICLM